MSCFPSCRTSTPSPLRKDTCRREAAIDTLAALVAEHGAPAYVRSDNGGEFIAERVASWSARQGSATVHIEPGHPWEHGFIESFNGTVWDECLNEEVFRHERHARVAIEAWRRHYNEERPHSALGYRTPAEATTATEVAAATSVARSDVLA